MWKALAKFAVLVGVVACGVFLVFHYDIHLLFTQREKTIAFLRSFGPLSVAVFVALQVFQVIFAPIPGEVTGFIGGCIFGAFLGTVYSTIGLTVGSWLAFTLARYFGLPFVEKFVSARIVRTYDHFIEHQGVMIVFVLFLIPGFPKDALCYLLGLSHMRTGIFLVVCTLGRLFGTITLSLGGHWFQGEQLLAFVVLAIVMGLVLLWAYLHREAILRRLKRRPPA